MTRVNSDYTDGAQEKLGREFVYSGFGRVDASHSAARFRTSRTSREEDADRLCRAIPGV